MTRGLKILITLVSIGMLIGIVLALALPKGADESKAESGGQEIVEETSSGGSETSQDNNGQYNQSGSNSQGENPTITINPDQGGGGTPGLVVTFPEPVGGGDEKPPESSGDIYGQWITQMNGSSYGLENCYLTLDKDGTISAPDNYDSVFMIAGSEFKWQSGTSDFTADVQAVLKLGNQNQIPLKIQMTGQVSASLDKIEGTFSAVPQSEAYTPYQQQGNFSMQR